MTIVRWSEPHPKPAKGTTRAARVQTRMAEEDFEAREKTKARKRDGRCRWPHCDCAARRDRLEVAHVVNKSLGGTSDLENLIVLCLSRHQGRPSLHSGDLKIERLTDKGTSGPCEYWARDAMQQWYMVARERAPFVLERD